LRTKEQYMERLSRMNRNLYANGEKIDRLDERQQPALNVMNLTFDAAWDEESRELCTATSHLTGERINRFTHIHQGTDDLVKKSKMGRLMGAYTGTCFQRCAGMDAINTLEVVTYDIDRAHGTRYHERFLKFLRYVQDEDLVCDAAMTDAKGDRRLRPAQQPTRSSF